MNQVPLILDTTYALPVFEIRIDLTPTFHEELKKLWKMGKTGFKLYLPLTCLIECAYKLNREYRMSKNARILTKYSANLPTILSSPVITLINPFTNPIISEIAMKIRAAGHPDLMDCWIAACAANSNGILLSEDKELKKLLASMPELKLLRVWDWAKFSRN
jgi:predicted nucleic acid-binding protein